MTHKSASARGPRLRGTRGVPCSREGARGEVVELHRCREGPRRASRLQACDHYRARQGLTTVGPLTTRQEVVARNLHVHAVDRPRARRHHAAIRVPHAHRNDAERRGGRGGTTDGRLVVERGEHEVTAGSGHRSCCRDWKRRWAGDGARPAVGKWARRSTRGPTSGGSTGAGAPSTRSASRSSICRHRCTTPNERCKNRREDGSKH